MAAEQGVVERLRDRLDQGFDPDSLVSADELRALLAVVEAAQELYELVEMDESVGICLSDRGPALTLGEKLAALHTQAPDEAKP